MKKGVIYALFMVSLWACKGPDQEKTDGIQAKPATAARNFPAVAKLDTILHTVFVQTLEHTLPTGKNVVYTPVSGAQI